MNSINPNYLVTIMTVNPDAGSPIVVRASLPHQFMFDSQSEYQAPFSQGLFGGSGALSSIAKVAGLRLTSQALTAQIWQGSSESQLNLDLEFQTETDPIADVRDPILALMKLATPRMSPGSGLLQSPGPQLDMDSAIELGKAYKDQVAGELGVLVDVGKAALKSGQMADSETQIANGNNQVQSTPPNGGLGQSGEWKRKVKNQISIAIGRYAFFDSVVITNVQKTYESQIDHMTGLPMYARVNVQFKPFFLLLQSDLDQIFAIQGGQQQQPQTNSLDSLF